jgi:MinD superfamily P-loop ATPase
MIPNDKSRYYSGSFRNGKMVYGRLAPGEENSGKLVNLVRELAGKTAVKSASDTIILDGPPGIGCPVISTITGVDQVIIVTEPTMSGLSDLKRAADISLRFGLVPSVIINKSDLNTAMTEGIVRWCGEKNIPVEGILPFDRKVVEAMVMGKTITEYEPENRVSIELKKIWNNILKSKKS